MKSATIIIASVLSGAYIARILKLFTPIPYRLVPFASGAIAGLLAFALSML